MFGLKDPMAAIKPVDDEVSSTEVPMSEEALPTPTEPGESQELEHDLGELDMEHLRTVDSAGAEGTFTECPDGAMATIDQVQHQLGATSVDVELDQVMATTAPQ